jgi:protein-tyrosine phosphatase
MRFILLIGGLPAFKELAPHLVDSSLTTDKAALARMRAKLVSRPAWATRALENLACSMAPAAQILPWLFLGGFEDVKRPVKLREMRITHVLVMAAELVDIQLPDDISAKRIEAWDRPDYDILGDFSAAIAFLDKVRRRREDGEDVTVLVHCYAGISRSASVVVAYLMSSFGLSTAEALHMVRSKRLGVAPNEGFLAQLEAWERRLRDCEAQDWAVDTP